jgi:hypothetical protein
MKTKQTNKFNAVRCQFDGEVFDSIKELKFYNQLKNQMKAVDESFKVTSIERQVRYDIAIAGQKIGFYKLDFKVTYADGKTRCFDVKGLKSGSAYQLFRLKKKIVEAIYGITIEEI